jgi:hypothetical protein
MNKHKPNEKDFIRMNMIFNPKHNNHETMTKGDAMYYYKEELINVITPDHPDPSAAKVLQETLGGHFGEMKTMMQFFSEFRGNDTCQKKSRPVVPIKEETIPLKMLRK